MTDTQPTDPFDRTGFFLEMITELSGSLEQVIGLEDAEGYFSLVGTTIGTKMSAQYRKASGHDDLSAEEVAQALVDLKTRIDGGFSVESINGGQITLVNTRCPFGDKVIGRRSLCMMTSNVFGTIAADAAGRATVDLQETIAAGDQGCRVVVHLGRSDTPGMQYFGPQA